MLETKGKSNAEYQVPFPAHLVLDRKALELETEYDRSFEGCPETVNWFEMDFPEVISFI